MLNDVLYSVVLQIPPEVAYSYSNCTAGNCFFCIIMLSTDWLQGMEEKIMHDNQSLGPQYCTVLCSEYL